MWYCVALHLRLGHDIRGRAVASLVCPKRNVVEPQASKRAVTIGTGVSLYRYVTHLAFQFEGIFRH